MPRTALTLALTLGLAGLAPGPAALGLSLTLQTSTDPTTLEPGDTFTVYVGLDEPLTLAGYGLDIFFDEELELTGASQKACATQSVGSCSSVPGFTPPTDPTNPAGAPDPGSGLTGRRAAALASPGSFLLTDSGKTSAPIDALFSLTFEAKEALVDDGAGAQDLRVAILDNTFGDLRGFDPETMENSSLVGDLDSSSATLAVAPVPEPSTLSLGVAGMGALAALRRRRARPRA